VNLDGKYDYIEILGDTALNVGEAGWLTGNLSINAWVKVNQTGAIGTHVIFDKESPVWGPGYGFYLLNGRPGLRLSDGTPTIFLASTSMPTDGQWHLVGVSVNRMSTTGGQFYVDGMPFGAPFNPTVRSGTLENNYHARIGSRAYGTMDIFKGSIDEVKIFKRALTATEQKSTFDAGSYGECKPQVDDYCLSPCPYGGVFDGANCQLGKAPAGTNAFLYKGTFYYTPLSGNTCLPGSWFDGANCNVQEVPTGATPFIYANYWYFAAAC